MSVSEKALLESGFSHSDIIKIKNNINSNGGSIDEAIRDLANRFCIFIFVVFCCLTALILLFIFGSKESLFSGSIGIFCGIVVAALSQPPILAYKSWRHIKACKPAQ